VVVSGDGAFGINAMEIDTAKRHNAKAVFIIANNAAVGTDKRRHSGLYWSHHEYKSITEWGRSGKPLCPNGSG
jgi:thiamine pyrophosphate-dependent acetolactate synthase large subunit-like protein